MIDTIKLRTFDFKIESQNSIIIQPSLIDTEGQSINDSLLFEVGNKKIRGAKAFLNRPNFNVSIKPIAATENKPPVQSLSVQYSIPKLIFSSNYASPSEKDISDSFSLISKNLLKEGISFNINKANLSRVDSFRNIETKDITSSYFPIFNFLSFSRTSKRDYGTTFLYQNSQQELCIYDKIQELNFKGDDVSDLPKNVLRFEHRLLNKSKIDSTLQISKVEELIDNYPVIQTSYLKSFSKLFKYEPDDIELILFNDIEKELLFYKSKNSRYWLNDFLITNGITNILNYTSIDVLKKAVNKVSQNRMLSTRLTKKIDQYYSQVFFRTHGKKKKTTYKDLYKEIKEKLLYVA